MSDEKNKKRDKIEIEVPKASICVEAAHCPEGCDLVDPSVKIHGRPSIGVRISFNDKEGMIHLDPTYGGFDSESEIRIPEGTVVEFSCPHCNVSLKDEDMLCQTCSSPMFVLHLPKGGLLEGCLKKGCTFHTLRIVDTEAHFLRVSRDELGMSRYDV